MTLFLCTFRSGSLDEVTIIQSAQCVLLDAYGWPHTLTDDQILERLLALNLERAAQGWPMLRNPARIQPATRKDSGPVGETLSIDDTRELL